MPGSLWTSGRNDHQAGCQGRAGAPSFFRLPNSGLISKLFGRSSQAPFPLRIGVGQDQHVTEIDATLNRP
jgi:hypothetical protein